MRKSKAYGIVVALMSVSLTLCFLEFAVRIHRGALLQTPSSESTSTQNTGGRIAYDAVLGWVPRPGRFSVTWTENVDVSTFRNNGRPLNETISRRRPILAVGDSFTFGDEVEDSETWPSYLEGLLNTRVLNAGVAAYGIDQAFLRAQLVLDKYDPAVVILAFISDDSKRTEYSYYPWGHGWKPYFEYRDGSLILINVPVPNELGPPRSLQSLRHVMRYSLLADAVFLRVAPRWWMNLPTVERVHHDGEKVSVELLGRLDRLVKERRGKFLAIAFATNGRIGGNDRLPNLVKSAREKGVEVLDLSTEILKLEPIQLKSQFRPGGHYSPAMNRAIAVHIAAFLKETGFVSASTQ